MKDLLLSLLKHYDQLLNTKGTPEDPHPPLAKEFFSVKSQSTKYKMQKTFPTTAGESDYNSKKNRYKDILPFDSTRFVLSETDGVLGSDYINANYLKGHDGRKVYIAAQGPLPQTVVDFWRLIWESDAQIVVMACNEYELGKHKCQKYWSEENESLEFGEISVQQISQECITKDFLIRKLHVSKQDIHKEIYQFHYTSWPDHGVPTTVEAIINMVKRMREYQVDGNVPLLIHCSAGCGRTGTICVIDYVRNLLKDEMIDKDFNIKSIILEMRKQRHAIVQSKEQYELVHKATVALFRETLQNKYGVNISEGHLYENWSLDQDLILRPETQKISSLPAQQPEIPRKSEPPKKVEVPKKTHSQMEPPKKQQSVENDNVKMNIALKPPLKSIKPQIPANKPSSPISKQVKINPPSLPIHKNGKMKPDSIPVSPTPRPRRSFDPIEDHVSKLPIQRHSEPENKIDGVKNLLLQQTKNLTGGLKTRSDAIKRPTTEFLGHDFKKKSPTDLKKPPENPKPMDRKSKNIPMQRPPHRRYDSVDSPGFETVKPEESKKAPPKPKRSDQHFDIPTLQRRSFPPTNDTKVLKPKQTPKPVNEEYTYVDHTSHLNDVIEREKVSGVVESDAYESLDLDPPYRHVSEMNEDKPLVPYAYTDINDAQSKPHARITPRRNTLDRAYEDINPQPIQRQKAAPRVDEESAYAEVGEYIPPETKTSSQRLASETSTASNNSGWSFTDDSFDEDEDDVPVVPQRTRAMYETLDEASEQSQPSPDTGTKKTINFGTFNINKIFGRNRGKIPEYTNPPPSANSQSHQNHQQSQPQNKQEEDMQLFEAIRNATFATKETYTPGPVRYENVDISFPKKGPKPKPHRNPPWRESYSIHYPQ